MEAEILRRAYELGRLRTSLLRAAIVCAPLAMISWHLAYAISWLPLTYLALTFAYWRGGAIQKGALFGVVGGLAAMIVPLSILRPDDCAKPECCLEVGVAIGLLIAAIVPVRKWSGLVLGVASVAMLRCSALYAGEAIGLVAGSIAGVLVMSAARSIYSKVTSTSAS